MGHQKPDLHDRDGKLTAVGVGASAGGLEAFSELLRHLPPATGMVFILVQHLDPHHQSALPELLSGKTRMPVVQVQNDTEIEPDHVYIIAPNTLLRVTGHKLTLASRLVGPEKFRPIDSFFDSLARDFGPNAVGIVLSGTASDGTLGLKTIKAEGGITFAQNQTAKFDSMPRSAIAAGVVDFVLSPRRIAEELAALSHRGPSVPGMETELVRGDSTLHSILLLLRKQTGVDFRQYKQATVFRRLNRRVVIRKAENIEQYFGLLQREPEEVKALFHDLLINVTDFFRDADVFEAVKRVVFPAILRDRKQPYALRAWIPACSSGEEVYSMAIALTEYLESEDLECRFQIFGTDVSDTIIEKARTGIYDESSVLNVSPERLRRFFVRTDAGYQISRGIREMCIFSRHNVAKDPPLSRMDLISCRNLLIYLSPSLQRRIIATFGYALQPGGCLILGSSETLGTMVEHFQPLDESNRIYLRKPNVPQVVFRPTDAVEEYLPRLSPPAPEREPAAAADGDRDVLEYANKMVLSRYGPAGVVVNEALRIVEYRGDVAPYLVRVELQPDADLMSVAAPHLRAPLGTAVEQARRTNTAVVGENIPSPGAERDRFVAITVIPMSLAGIPRHFLILFGRLPEVLGLPQPAATPGEEPNAAGPMSLEEENAHLRQELKTTREYLQSVIEELRSTNEEAQSANEELQSTNEEMQTSKEELQSSNEELNTINEEMQSRNAELAELNDDLINLLGSMNMPIVMTGNDLRIRRFTPSAEKVLRLIATDVGRPIADLKPRIDVPNLEEILQHVVDTLEPHEQEVQDREGRQYLVRVRPYRTADNRIDGAVLQLLDVTELKHSLEEVLHARDYAEAIVNTVREPLVVLDQNLAIQDANTAFYDALEITRGAAVGQTIYQVARGRFDLPEAHQLFDQLDSGSTQSSEIEIEYHAQRGETRVLAVNARRLRAHEQNELILMAFQDITDRKRAAEARYRRLFESARDGIVLVDASTGEVIEVNPFVEQLLGYTADELIGRKLWDIEAMRSIANVHAIFDRVRDQGVHRFDDLLMRRKDGRDLQTEVIANVYSEGERRALQFNIRDVTDRKKFERELMETQKLESLGLLAGGIAHDFNNLLTGILGNASLAFTEVRVDDPVRMRMRQIVQASERAAFLTRQMLAYAGRGRFVTESIDLGNLVREISTLVRASIPNTVEVRLDLAPDVPPIEADSAQMQQVIMNLVINAAEAIGEGATGRVDIRTCASEIDEREASHLLPPEKARPGLYVQLEVSDTGSGMDEATKARIFDPFFTTKFTGRGLGLAAVQGIIKGHGGAIRVYSTPGHGTTFVVMLPAQAQKPASAQPPKPKALAIPAGSVALVIDDEQAIRSLSENVLSRAGMKVLAAENGVMGVELFRQHNAEISVVILDLQMPVMAGEETLARLNEINPDIPVILSSGFDQAEAARRFSGAKVKHFLQKPYTADGLAQAVAAALNRKSAKKYNQVK